MPKRIGCHDAAVGQNDQPRDATELGGRVAELCADPEDLLDTTGVQNGDYGRGVCGVIAAQ